MRLFYPKTKADSTLVESAFGNASSRLLREWIGAILDVNDLAGLSLAAFKMRLRTARVLCPQSLTLPALLRVVDASVEILGKEAHRIRDAHHDPLAVDERVQRVGVVAGR